MYLPRLLRPALDRALEQFPAVLITGPRQSGKTTFLREELGASAGYVSFDDPLERDFARSDPDGFLDRFGEGRAILDEIQYVPELLQHLKLRIDRDRRNYGRWLLTGSQRFQLMAGIGESLAGRIAILELPPLSLLETPERAEGALEPVIWNGGYPEPALEPEKRELWLSSYLQTYVERDVRQLSNVQDLRAFETFLALCAARHGQELNQADLARSAGVSQPTVKSWLGVLEAAYVALLVPPYFENLGKRVVKSPKLHFLDPALVCALTRQPSAEAAVAGAMGGALFEGWVVSEAYKVLALEGRRPDLYFWRSRDGLEVDLLIRAAGRLLPVEVKLTATPTPRHLQPLEKFRALAGDAADAGVLVCRVGERRPLPGGNLALPWREFPGWLRERVAV
jgi:predicted AAA+ superfamily ATPase